MARRLPILLLVALPAWGCGDGAPSKERTAPIGESTGHTGTSPTSVVTGHTGVPALAPTWSADPDAPTFVTVAFTPRPGPVTLTWSDAAGSHSATVDGEAGRLRLLGLPAGSDVAWTLSAEDASSGPHQASVEAAPEPLALWTVTHHDDAEVDDHWLLGTQFAFGGRSFALVVDAEGRIRWWREAPPEERILRIHPADDGVSLVWASNDADRSEERGHIVREPLDGSGPIETVAPGLHHDFVEHPGGFAFLAHVDQDMHVGDLVGPKDPMTSDVIRVVTEGATGTYDDVFSYFESWPAPVEIPCFHARLGAFVPDRIEWTHSNSLLRAADGDGWWVLPRYLDALARVRADGSLTAIVGGDVPTLAFSGDGLPFAHGHASHVTDAGTILVFDNGDHVHQVEGSRVVELAIDEVAGTVDEVWRTPEPEGRFVTYLGDARRLPGGNTLIVNPDHGIWEVTPDGTVVWEGHQDPEHRFNQNLGRMEAITPWLR